MATIRKFTFDLDFEDPEGRARSRSGQAPRTLGEALLGEQAAAALSAARASAPAPEPQPPTPEPEPEPEPQGPTLLYSEEDLEIVREDAFAEGHAAALQDQAAQIERTKAESLNACAKALKQVPPLVTRAHQEIADLAAHVALAVCRKLLPHTAPDYAAREVEGLVRGLLPSLLGQSRLIVRVGPDMAEAVRPLLEKTVEESGFEGRLVVNEDTALSSLDARIEWPDGGAERNTTRLWAEVDALLDRNLPRFSRADALVVPGQEAKPQEAETSPWPDTIDPAAWWVPPAPRDEDTAVPPLHG